MELAYHGKAYHGWQKQPNALSVQEVLENALEKLFQKKIEIVGAGRTDAGVHAKQIFAHFDFPENLNNELLYQLNALLPKVVAINGIFQVKPDAHARFDALSRTYEYHIHQKKDPFAVETSFLVKRKLNIEKMQLAANILPEYESFKSFSRSRTDVKTFDCSIKKADWKIIDEKLIFEITANRFLRNMVRAIVGTLLDVGLEKIEVEKVHEIIASENRGEAGASVPAHGLFLTKVEYPKNIFIN